MLGGNGLLLRFVADLVGLGRDEVDELGAAVHHQLAGVVGHPHVRKRLFDHLVDGSSGDRQVVIVAGRGGHRPLSQPLAPRLPPTPPALARPPAAPPRLLRRAPAERERGARGAEGGGGGEELAGIPRVRVRARRGGKAEGGRALRGALGPGPEI